MGRLTKEGSSSNYNQFQLWVNPDFGDLSTPDVTFGEAGSLAAFDTVGFRTANLVTPTDKLLVDELRIATSWSDVVVPEPTALAIWATLAGVAAAVGWRRRRL